MLLRFRRFLHWALLAAIGLALIGLIALATVYYLVSPKLPDVETLHNVELQEPMYVYASDGRLMAVFGETRRYPVDIADVPEPLKKAFIAIEDSRFYEHNGVDYRGVARAVWLLATTRDERVPGGSTITQQVARQFFLSSEYSYTRKIAEMMLAWRMEKELSKDEILELYLNKSFFGNRAYGVGAAAEFYYGKKLNELDLDEVASLAAIPKFPSSGNPLSNPDRARIRRDYVLQRMAELGFVSASEASRAQSVGMHASPHEPPIQLYAPFVAEMVRQEMIARYGAEALSKGFHVTTTIDTQMQRAANQAVRDGLVLYDKRHGWHGVEQHFDLAENEDAAAAKARLRGINVQSDMLPSIVLATAETSATVVLPSGREVTLDRSQGWGGRSPASLLKRGDLVRVHRIHASEGDGKKVVGADPTSPRYELTQLPRAESALVSLEANTGALRALSGGFSFAGSKFNRATQARRQPGSSFKPFLYAAALEKGFNPASVVLDAPVVFNDRRGHQWRPQNDDGKFSGPMRLREALVRSRNLVSVRLLDSIGVDYARKYISHFGFEESSLPPNLSMSLGTASLTPLSVARGYAVFANGGFLVDPWFIQEVRDRDGAMIFQESPATACRTCDGGSSSARPSAIVGGFNLGPPTPTPAPAVANDKKDEPAPPQPENMVVAPRAIDGRVAYQMVSMMRDVVQRGTGTRAKVLGREDVGGKTGSTNEHRDAWFAGFGGDLATIVWVGRDNFQPLGRGEYGGQAALPIWINFMRAALEDRALSDNTPPDEMIEVQVSANGRLIAGGSGGLTEWVKVEDLERMQSYAAYDDESDTPAEDSFDIF